MSSKLAKKALPGAVTFYALGIAILLATGCGGGGSSDEAPEPNLIPAPPVSPPDPDPEPEDDGEDNRWKFTRLGSESGLLHRWGIEGAIDNTEVTQAEFFGGGIAVGDFDNDGWIDLYINSGNQEAAKLFRNLGNNRFEDVAAQAGVQLLDHRGSGPTFADVDGDGWLDLFVGGLEGDPNYLFINRGDGTFSDQSAVSGLRTKALNTVSAAFGDYDRDGHLDVAFSHWGNPFSSETETLFRGHGDGTFTDVSRQSGIADQILTEGASGVEGERDYSFTPTFADFNNDGWPDLSMVGDFGTSKYFLNDGEGRFSDATNGQLTDEFGMGSAIGDLDNDGDLDWFVTSVYEFNDYAVTNIGNRLYLNDNGNFSDGTFYARVENGGWGWGACAADLNNDGFQDIFHTSGWYQDNGQQNPTEEAPVDQTSSVNRAFIATGDGRYSERAVELGLTHVEQGRAVVCFDADRDGDIDLLVVGNTMESQAITLYRNDGAAAEGNYLQVELQGGNGNPQAAGARVYVTANGVTQMRELHIGSSFTSQNPSVLHFGLGSATATTALTVRWPNGSEQSIDIYEVNQRLVIRE
uniref:CRTAC1 family protein n=1 Tax=Microbulbifer agarilyticus TaxID=260552 RepID=UPI0002559D2C|nr:CRTAC1 family protein [Microbulbifer agarilyticus]